jgi:hypothetical protein
MNVIELSVATRVFRLPTGTDIEHLQRVIRDAVHAGGALVDIPSIGDARITALVTPATPVFVERIDVDDAPSSDSAWFEMEHFGEAWIA